MFSENKRKSNKKIFHEAYRIGYLVSSVKIYTTNLKLFDTKSCKNEKYQLTTSVVYLEIVRGRAMANKSMYTPNFG